MITLNAYGSFALLRNLNFTASQWLHRLQALGYNRATMIEMFGDFDIENFSDEQANGLIGYLSVHETGGGFVPFHVLEQDTYTTVEVYEGVRIEMMVTDQNEPVSPHHYYRFVKDATGELLCELNFQDGCIPDYGINGTTNEAVLMALLDRLEYLNAKFSCRENSIAINGMQIALDTLKLRTENRIARNVEGKEVE